jgi:hypothetical protein
MKAKVGDWIRVLGHHTSDPDRIGQIVGVRGDGGSPPFEVRWVSNDHVTIFFPGSDAVIEQPHPTGR